MAQEADFNNRSGAEWAGGLPDRVYDPTKPGFVVPAQEEGDDDA